MDPFEPDAALLALLQAEHVNGTWVGKELLAVANRIRNRGGNEDDYLRWVRASNLWLSYTCSTGDRTSKQEDNLETAWLKALDSKPFDLEESLSELTARIASSTEWKGRTGTRDRAVALALVRFCSEHNCFTRTLSSYELSKWTAGLSQRSVSRALVALVDLGLLHTEERTDRRTSTRSAKRYRVNLRWRPPGGGGVSNTDSRNTGKHSLSQELPPPSDIWSPKGLGLGAQRVFESLTDEPVTARRLSDQTGTKVPSAKRYLKILTAHGLAGIKVGAPGAPNLYFRVDTPLDAIAESLGILGHVEVRGWEIEQRQALNRAAYAGAYHRLDERPAPKRRRSFEERIDAMNA